MKYALTNKTTKFGKHVLYQIIASKDIPCHNVKEGDLGGYIESEQNLSQKGNCWIDTSVRLIGTTQIKGNALLQSEKRGINNNSNSYGTVSVIDYDFVQDVDAREYNMECTFTIKCIDYHSRANHPRKYAVKKDGKIVSKEASFKTKMDSFFLRKDKTRSEKALEEMNAIILSEKSTLQLCDMHKRFLLLLERIQRAMSKIIASYSFKEVNSDVAEVFERGSNILSQYEDVYKDLLESYNNSDTSFCEEKVPLFEDISFQRKEFSSFCDLLKEDKEKAFSDPRLSHFH